MAGIDLRVSAACWFDAVWSILMDAPGDRLQKASDQMTLAQNRARPDRETWGMTPEQQAMMQRAVNQPAAPPARPTRRRGDGTPMGG